MSLTLANAAEVLDHCAATTPCGGFTRTSHRAGHIEPGDLWRPDPFERPHTVTEVRRRGKEVVLMDQVGDTYRYPVDAVVATAVSDPLVLIPG